MTQCSCPTSESHSAVMHSELLRPGLITTVGKLSVPEREREEKKTALIFFNFHVRNYVFGSWSSCAR